MTVCLELLFSGSSSFLASYAFWVCSSISTAASALFIYTALCTSCNTPATCGNAFLHFTSCQLPFAGRRGAQGYEAALAWPPHLHPHLRLQPRLQAPAFPAAQSTDQSASAASTASSTASAFPAAQSTDQSASATSTSTASAFTAAQSTDQSASAPSTASSTASAFPATTPHSVRPATLAAPSQGTSWKVLEEADESTAPFCVCPARIFAKESARPRRGGLFKSAAPPASQSLSRALRDSNTRIYLSPPYCSGSPWTH